MTDHLMSKTDAKKALGDIGNTKLYELLNDGIIEGVKIGSLLKIKPESVSRYIASLPKYKKQGEEAND